MPALVPLPLTSTRTISSRWPDRLRCATTKSPENRSPWADRMVDVACHPSGRSGSAPPDSIRSRSSASIRSPPNPRVPTTDRQRAATNITARTAVNEPQRERRASGPEVRQGKVPGVEHERGDEDDEEAPPGEGEARDHHDGEEQGDRHLHRPAPGGGADDEYGHEQDEGVDAVLVGGQAVRDEPRSARRRARAAAWRAGRRPGRWRRLDGAPLVDRTRPGKP